MASIATSFGGAMAFCFPYLFGRACSSLAGRKARAPSRQCECQCRVRLQITMGNPLNLLVAEASGVGKKVTNIMPKRPPQASLEEIYLPTSKTKPVQANSPIFLATRRKFAQKKKWHSQKNTKLNSNFDGFVGEKRTNKSAKRVPQGKSEPNLPTCLTGPDARV